MTRQFESQFEKSLFDILWPEQPATTVSPTTDNKWAAQEADSMTPTTSLLRRLLHAMTEAERTHVVSNLELWDLLEKFVSSCRTVAPVADGQTSTSQKLDSFTSAVGSVSVGAPSPSPELSNPDVRGFPTTDYLGENAGYPVHKDSALGKALSPDPVSTPSEEEMHEHWWTILEPHALVTGRPPATNEKAWCQDCGGLWVNGTVLPVHASSTRQPQEGNR